MSVESIAFAVPSAKPALLEDLMHARLGGDSDASTTPVINGEIA